MAVTHASGQGELAVSGKVLVPTQDGSSREFQNQELLRVPIVREPSGTELLNRARGAF
ncbi:MAG TPA: hypothetical protein VMW41_02930 [Candidatus Bathyarchaeia archaeon]|nr:hypothetical protein [Candidatus Bathyarchaeia archaeon]